MRVLILSVVLFLGGCASIGALQPGVDDDVLFVEHQKRLEPLVLWRIEGRIAIKGGEQNGKAFFRWRQNHDQFDLRLSGPLGGRLMHAWGGDETISVDLPRQQTVQIESMSDLASDTGLRLPVGSLRYWLKGSIDPENRADYKLNAKGYLKELYQNGWTITFKRYSSVDYVALPDKIFLRNGDYEVRLVVSGWEID